MSKDFEIKGFDKLESQLTDIENKAEKFSKKTSVQFDELFTSKFMSKHSKFSSIDDFAKAGNFDISSNEAFESIPNQKWEDWVKQSTDFSDWEEMMNAALQEMVKDQLGF